MIEYELVKAREPYYKGKMERTRHPFDVVDKTAPDSYAELVRKKSPLVSGLTEEEFHATHSWDDDLQAWKRQPKGASTLPGARTPSDEMEDMRNLNLFIKFMKNEPTAIGADDDDEEEEENGELSEEAKQAIIEDMTDPNAPKIPYEDIPERNRPKIPDVFQDAFPDDEEEIENALDVFKGWVEKDDGLGDWLKRKFGRKKEDIPQGDSYFKPEDADLEEKAKHQEARWKEIQSRDPNTWEERWKPGYPAPSPQWHKAGFSSYKEWQEAGSPEPKPKYTPKGRGRPWNKLSDEERKKRDLAQSNLSMASIEDKLTQTDLQYLNALKNPKPELPSKRIADDDPRLVAAQRATARIDREKKEKKLTRSELLQQLVEEEKREWQAMKDVAREEDAKSMAYSPPKGKRSFPEGESLAPQFEQQYAPRIPEETSDEHLGNLLDQRTSRLRMPEDYMTDQEIIGLTHGKTSPESKARLTRLMEPEKRPISEGLIANKLYKAFGIGGS